MDPSEDEIIDVLEISEGKQEETFKRRNSDDDDGGEKTHMSTSSCQRNRMDVNND